MSCRPEQAREPLKAAHEKLRQHPELHARGERAGRAKLDWDRVAAVRMMSRSGWTLRKIAETFDVAHATVWAIVSGKTWRVPRES